MMGTVIGRVVVAVHHQDQEIFERFQNGDQALYHRYYLLIYHLALRYLRHRQDAEDLTQDIFIGLYRASYNAERGSLASYLTTLTGSRAIDRLRSRTVAHKYMQRWQQIHQDGVVKTPLEFSVTKENQHQVRAALTQLPLTQRQLLEMAYYGELSQQKISQTLKIPLGTVKYRMRQGILAMRRKLNSHVQ